MQDEDRIDVQGFIRAFDVACSKEEPTLMLNINTARMKKSPKQGGYA